jgi:sugar phosphate isomerase/epimerase
MTRLAVSSMFFHEYPLADIFALAAGSGADTLEFWVETPHFWLNGLTVADITAALQDYPGFAPVALHAPVLDLNPCSINPGVADLSLSYVRTTMEIAREVGADTVTVHPGKRTAKREPSAYDYRRFENLVDLLREWSVGGSIRICIENMAPAVNALLTRPEEVRELLDREPWLYLTLDTAHALNGRADDLERFWETCRDRIANIHLSSAREGVMHLPVRGDPVPEQFLARLSGDRYGGLVTLEIEDLTFDAPMGMEEKMTFLSQELEYIREFLS